MQAEGGFGSRRFGVGCFASSVEFGPQHLADINKTRPASKILFQVLITHKPNLQSFVRNQFTKLLA
jgi:hypothetical protein